MNTRRETKIVWFMFRTGSSRAEAQEWLSKAKFKIEVAIRLRKDFNWNRG